jgi:hypothetical protein
MLVLPTGMIRSGSTWSFNVCINLLREAGIGDIRADFVKSSLGEWRQVVSQDRTHAVLKCHTLDAESLDWLKNNRHTIKFVYTFRDPREVAASALATFNMSLDDGLSAAEISLQFLSAQRAIGAVCVVPYSLIDQGRSGVAITALADYLELDLPASAISAVDDRCGRDSHRALLERFATLPPSEIHRDERFTYHRPTQLHHNHFRASDAPRWENLLNEHQVQRAAQIVQSNAPLFELDAVTILR